MARKVEIVKTNDTTVITTYDDTTPSKKKHYCYNRKVNFIVDSVQQNISIYSRDEFEFSFSLNELVTPTVPSNDYNQAPTIFAAAGLFVN